MQFIGGRGDEQAQAPSRGGGGGGYERGPSYDRSAPDEGAGPDISDEDIPF